MALHRHNGGSPGISHLVPGSEYGLDSCDEVIEVQHGAGLTSSSASLNFFPDRTLLTRPISPALLTQLWLPLPRFGEAGKSHACENDNPNDNPAGWYLQVMRSQGKARDDHYVSGEVSHGGGRHYCSVYEVLTAEIDQKTSDESFAA
jgi:hypothetical protein